MKQQQKKKVIKSILFRWKIKYINWNWKEKRNKERKPINKTKVQLNIMFTYFAEMDYGDGMHIHFFMRILCLQSVNVNFFPRGQNLDRTYAILPFYCSEYLNRIIIEQGPFPGLIPRACFYPPHLPILISNVAQHCMGLISPIYIQEIQFSYG